MFFYAKFNNTANNDSKIKTKMFIRDRQWENWSTSSSSHLGYSSNRLGSLLQTTSENAQVLFYLKCICLDDNNLRERIENI